VLVAACGGGDGKDGQSGESGADGLNALIATAPIAAGDDCVAGGYQVRSGQDLNDDGNLSSAETRTTDYICNGSDAVSDNGGAGPDASSGKDGLTSLVSVTTIALGDDDCAAGGLRLEAGLDTDGSGSLEPLEVTTTRALCNGEPGAAANKGDPGLDSLIVTHPVDEGSDDCAAGGTRIDIGQDADRDGALSEAEISTTSYVCHGEKGADGAPGKDGNAALVVVGAEPAGDHCAYGGSVITSGLDDGTPGGTAGDGVLDPAEVNAAATTYLCRPEPSLEDLLAPPGQVVSLHLEGGPISADFAVIEHLGSENALNTAASKTGSVTYSPGDLSYPATVLHGRISGAPLDGLLAWRHAVEISKVQRTNLTLTATDLATDDTIAVWTLSNAWPSALEVKSLKGSSEPEVRLEIVFEDLATSKLTGAVTKNEVQLTASGSVDTTCSSIAGIGSSSFVNATDSGKGTVTQAPGSYEDYWTVCTRPLDGELTLSKWRQGIVDGNASPRAMTITLDKELAFDFTAAWPSKSYVDTGPDGTLVQSVTLVANSYIEK